MVQQLEAQQIGEAVKTAIKQAGLTQEEAGIKAGIPRNSLNRKINGGTFNMRELTRLSQVTGRRLSQIIRDAEALAGKEELGACACDRMRVVSAA